ncbi:MAG: DUF1707 domain-containing protein [Corynebacterium matruchotii]
MNPQTLPPYPRDPVSKFASWDYPIGNIERWHAKTSLDQHYAAGKLQPTEYETRMVGIMGATMWSHLVAIFADLPAPGPAYDGKQLLKACHAAQKAQPTSPSVTILLPILLGLTLLIILIFAGPVGFVLSLPVFIVPIIVIPMAAADKYKRVYQNFSNQLNLQQRALLDEAASEEYAKYYWSQQQGQYQQQLLQQQQIQNMFNNINRQY